MSAWLVNTNGRIVHFLCFLQLDVGRMNNRTIAILPFLHSVVGRRNATIVAFLSFWQVKGSLEMKVYPTYFVTSWNEK